MLKIVSVKKYKRIIQNLGSRIVYCSIDFSGNSVDGIQDLDDKGKKINIISCTSAIYLIEKMHTKLDRIEKIIKGV